MRQLPSDCEIDAKNRSTGFSYLTSAAAKFRHLPGPRAPETDKCRAGSLTPNAQATERDQCVYLRFLSIDNTAKKDFMVCVCANHGSKEAASVFSSFVLWLQSIGCEWGV